MQLGHSDAGVGGLGGWREAGSQQGPCSRLPYVLPAAIVSLAVCQGQVQLLAGPAPRGCQNLLVKMKSARASPAASCQDSGLAAVLCLTLFSALQVHSPVLTSAISLPVGTATSERQGVVAYGPLHALSLIRRAMLFVPARSCRADLLALPSAVQLLLTAPHALWMRHTLCLPAGAAGCRQQCDVSGCGRCSAGSHHELAHQGAGCVPQWPIRGHPATGWAPPGESSSELQTAGDFCS